MTRNTLRRLTAARPRRLDPPDRDHAAGVQEIVGRTDPLPSSRTRRSRPWLLSAGLAATAVAAAVTVFVTTSTSTPTPARSGPAPGSQASPPSGPVLSAKDVLLTAARTTLRENEPATTGRWWASKREGAHVEQASMSGKKFRVLVRFREEYWHSQQAGTPSYYVYQELGAVPLTAEDAAIVEGLGSPSEYGTGEKVARPGPDGKPVEAEFTYPVTPGKVIIDEQPYMLYALQEAKVRWKDLATLTADPARLKAIVAAQSSSKDPSSAFVSAFALYSLPVSTEVRAELYTILSELPGATSVGRVRDAKGRLADTVVFDSNKRKTWYLIDAETGAPIGSEIHSNGGELSTYDLRVSTGYENTAPTR